MYVSIYEISCMSSGDDDDLGRTLGRTGVLQSSSDDRVTPINNPTARGTCWASYRLAKTLLVARWSCHPVKEGQGDYGEEALARRLWGGGPYQEPCLPLADALPLPHPCIISHVNNTGILFVAAKIYTHKNYALTPFPPKHENLTPMKTCTLAVCTGGHFKPASSLFKKYYCTSC